MSLCTRFHPQQVFYPIGMVVIVTVLAVGITRKEFQVGGL